MSILAIALSLVLSILSFTNAAKILAFYPTPSLSHQIVFRPLTNELIKRGHHVTVITTDPEYPKGKTPANLTEIDVHDLSYKLWRDLVLAKTTGKSDKVKDQIGTIFIIMLKIIEAQYQDEQVKKVIDKSNQYDLLIFEAYSRPTYALSHIFKVPVILFSSFGLILDNYQHMGVPQHEILYPTIMRRKLYNLTTWEKISELYEWIRLLQFYYNFENEENSMIKETFGEDMPPVSELANNIDMIFLNMHPIFEGIRPMPPNVIHIYGIHQKPRKELPEDIKKYLDSSKNGVIYISFGTNAPTSLIPHKQIEALKNVMSTLPYDILWKWDEGKMANKSKNVKVAKWFPQSDILRHPKVKLFIMQGGLQSTDEAITGGVPLIGIPMLGDQWFNVNQYVFLKIGLMIELKSLTEDNLRSAVDTIMGDDSYRQNIVKLRTIMHDQPEKPVDRAIWWTEYVLRNGGAKHLRSPASNMSWIDFMEIKLVLTLLAIIVTVISIVLWTIFKLGSILFGKNRSKKVKKN